MRSDSRQRKFTIERIHQQIQLLNAVALGLKLPVAHPVCLERQAIADLLDSTSTAIRLLVRQKVALRKEALVAAALHHSPQVH